MDIRVSILFLSYAHGEHRYDPILVQILVLGLGDHAWRFDYCNFKLKNLEENCRSFVTFYGQMRQCLQGLAL